MDLDDQLRSAHQRRLTAARDRLQDHEVEVDQFNDHSSVVEGPSLSTRVLAVAAGLFVVVGLGWAIADSLGNETASTQAASGGIVDDGQTGLGGGDDSFVIELNNDNQHRR